jgi:hypothetical protein
VCWNTLQLSLKGATQKHSIRHTVSAKNKLDEALKIMRIASKNSEVATAEFTRMAETKLAQTQFWDYIGNIFFSPAEIKELQDGKQAGDVISTRKTNTINKVIAFAKNGVGQKQAGEGSAWWAYNAVTGYFSNDAEYATPEARMEGLLFGSAATHMQKALTLAHDPSLIQSTRANVLSSMNFN